MTYEPNFDDPRCLKRLWNAYGFCRAFVSLTKPKGLSRDLINKHFGPASSQLSRWLRDRLLICTNNHYSMDNGKVKEYLLNEEGAITLRAVLMEKDVLKTHASKTLRSKNISPSSPNTIPIQYHSDTQVLPPTPAQPCLNYLHLFDKEVATAWVQREFEKDLRTLNFSYKDRASRWWHPLQNVGSDIRTDVLADAGLTHHYDIASCAPTLILQHAQHLGMDEYLFGLMDYLQNKSNFRRHVQTVGEIEDHHDAKVTINAMFCGARLGANRDFALYHVLDGNLRGIRALRADERLTRLKNDIKTCWDAIEPSLPVITTVSKKTGRERKKPLSSKRKWCLYFDLERRVMGAVRDYLKTNGFRFFLIHDGWATDREVDTNALQAFIEQRAGFTVVVSS